MLASSLSALSLARAVSQPACAAWRAAAAIRALSARCSAKSERSEAAVASHRSWLVAGAAGLLSGAALMSWTACGEAPQSSTRRTFTKEEVAQHKTAGDRIWVTYRDGVYDITDFVQMHPGGAQKIMLAAGGSVEPFWAMYQQHSKPEILEILKEYRIGDLAGADQQAAAPAADPYQHDPPRHPALVVQSAKPFNAETPAGLLAAAIVTPTDLFYVRNHLPVPDVDAASFVLTVEGEGVRTLRLTLAELQSQFKKHTITATVQCAGNRRSEMKAVKPVKGLNWESGAIGTATWGGVRLRDVLRHAGLSEGDGEYGGVAHIHFEGLDKDVTGTPYAASVPVGKAMSPQGDVLLAYEMNGQPLGRDHGAPLRAVVPGVVGARSVKWLGRVVASKDECQGFWQQRDYKAFCPSVDWDNVDWDSAPALQETPVQAAITQPEPGSNAATDEDGHAIVSGYAFSGGGRDIIRVDVSADGGATWQPAQLQKAPHQLPGRSWAWTLWEARVPVPEDAGGKLQLVCKATDEAYNTQPDSTAAIWNLRGVVTNSWHRVAAQVEH